MEDRKRREKHAVLNGEGGVWQLARRPSTNRFEAVQGGGKLLTHTAGGEPRREGEPIRQG